MRFWQPSLTHKHLLYKKSPPSKMKNTTPPYHKPCIQGSKIALVRSYLRVPQAAGQVEILIVLVKNYFFLIYVNNFCDAGQVPIFRYFEACVLRVVFCFPSQLDHYRPASKADPIGLPAKRHTRQ